ncbi:MAG: replication initiator protein [Microviridae sp.]|nr:MAG: replication initiator protein [Microviridae sp.]
MCLYPTLANNPKYKANSKNGGNIPPVPHPGVRKVPIGCGECMECRKQKAREWQGRMLEDIKEHTNGKFITLTFSNESIQKLIKENKELQETKGYLLDNAIATRATRLFLERWRKEYKKSLRHWFITELGHKGTENIHIHGIVWTDEPMDKIRKHWDYGYMWPRPGCKQKNYVNARTVNYIIKYVTKVDEDHKYYKSQILTSPGIGANYVKRTDWKKNKYNGENTNEAYRTGTGHKIGMPIYWRNKIYSEEEREKLWIQKIEKKERWICGEKVDISKNEESYYRLLEHYREKNRQLGYGTGEKDWDRIEYEKSRREMQQAKRLEQKKETFSKIELKENETYIEIGKWREGFPFPDNDNPDANAPD